MLFMVQIALFCYLFFSPFWVILQLHKRPTAGVSFQCSVTHLAGPVKHWQCETA